MDDGPMKSSPAPFTFAGAMIGARLTLPLVPGIVVFATAFGAAASQKGLDLWQTMALSAFVFAGASQMVALEVWRDGWTVASAFGLMMITLTINARMILMGAAIQPWMAGTPKGRSAAMLFFLTDANWLLAMRHRAEGGSDLAVLAGSGLTLWVIWVAATLPGYLAGAFVADPEAFGLDLVMPIFFAAMLAPLWRGAGPALPWAVAGIVALAAQQFFEGYVFIIAGALAGAATGALRRDRA
jgi:predicted branched-subunit amino acid permease